MVVSAKTYDAKLESSRRRQAIQTAIGKDIGELPKVKNPPRRRRAFKSFAFFCQTYFPASFTLKWGAFHHRAAKKIERAIREGGRFAFAFPRGSGKSVMSRWAALWAILTGQCKFVVIVGANEKEAERHIEQLKTELRTNKLLREDFPCECYPISRLGKSARKAEGQTYKYEPTCIEWKSTRIALPWIEERHAKGAGAVIEAFGLTASIRGVSHTMPNGVTIRPTLAICDDPQTRESAKSATQCHEREQIIVGDVAYLAGPGQPISIFMPCTVICEGDLSDRFLNTKLHPEWQGERVAMVEKFPKNTALWDTYANILANSGNDGYALKAATKFYAENRAAMDEDFVVSWPERKYKHELSAQQHAINWKLQSETAFWAEFQNQPLARRVDMTVLSRDQMAAKVSGFGRGVIPSPCQVVTAMIDVQGALLYWLVSAWTSDFSGYIVDYGSWPDQGRAYFTQQDASRTLKWHYPGFDDEASLHAGITELVATIVGREWKRDDGATMRIGRCMVDANWGKTSELVNLACRQSPYANVLTPSYGRGITATQKRISEWKAAKNIACGPEWIPTRAKGNHLVGVIYDTNFWKKRWHDGMALPIASRGSINLFAAPADIHRMFCDHVASEPPKKTEHDGNVVYEFPHEDGADNHLFDCAVGSMVAASLCGIRKSFEAAAPARSSRPKRKVSYQ